MPQRVDVAFGFTWVDGLMFITDCHLVKSRNLILKVILSSVFYKTEPIYTEMEMSY